MVSDDFIIKMKSLFQSFSSLESIVPPKFLEKRTDYRNTCKKEKYFFKKKI